MSDGDMKLGCVIFDDPRLHQTGWKADGENIANRINFQGTGSLPSDTIWLTNLNYEVSAQSGLLSNYRFQKSDYLREDLSRMAERHAISDSRETAEYGAKIFTRTLRAMQSLLGCEPNYIPKYYLKTGFREHLWGKDPCLPKDIAKIIEEAISYNCNCERNAFTPRNEDITGYFKVPPREHCLNVLQVSLPVGEIFELPKKSLPGKETPRQDVLDWLLNQQAPGFFRVTCNNFDDAFNRLINYGVSPSAAKRQWVSSPELAWLASFADVTIHQAYTAQSSVTLTEAIQMVEQMPEITELSISMGILYENVWSGMSTKLPERMCPSDKKSVNPFTPFIRAQDRISLFPKAVAMAQLGFDVLGYATGTIRVSLKDKNPYDVFMAAQKTGLIPPFLGLEAANIPAPRASLDFVQWHYGTNKRQELLELDKKIIAKLTEKSNE